MTQAVCAYDAWNSHPSYDVPNFHRIVVHGSTFPLEWLKLTVDPSANPRPAQRVRPVQLAADAAALGSIVNAALAALTLA